MASNPVFYPNLQQQQQPVVYMQPQQHQESENAPFVAQNLPYFDSIYAQPQQVPEQAAPQPAPLQAQAACAGRQCSFSKCCKKFNKVKAQKAALILPIIIFTIGTIKSFFSFGRYNGWNYSNIFTLVMVIISSIVGFIAIKKNKMHLHGIHIGMNFFLILSFIGFGITSLFAGMMFYNFRSFWSVLVGFLELVAIAAQIASVIFSLKDIKRIKAELELPLDQQEQTVQEITLENTQIPPAQPGIPQPVPQPVPQSAPVQVPVVQQQQMVDSITGSIISQSAPVQVPVVQQQQQMVHSFIPQPSPQNRFKNELVLLREMGFANEILNIQLLVKHNGNLQAVVQEYIQTH